MRYAAIDIGTNSCRLLIADKDKEHNRLIPVYKDLKTTRLGEGVNARGTISVPAMQRTIDCLAGFQQCINEYQARQSIVLCIAGTQITGTNSSQWRLTSAVCPFVF